MYHCGTVGRGEVAAQRFTRGSGRGLVIVFDILGEAGRGNIISEVARLSLRDRWALAMTTITY
jgi:hypothetical protein